MSRHGGTRNHTSNAYHGQAAVLELLHLHFLSLGRVLGVKSERVEVEVSRLTIELVHVSKGGEGNSFEEGDPSEDLDHGVRESIVRINNLWDGGEGKLFTGNANELGNDESNCSEHSSTTVLEFGFTEPREPFGSSL